MPIPVKLTRAHQVTLPKRLLERAGWLKQEFFVADLRGNYLVLKPLTLESATALASFEDLRRHFAQIGIAQKDVREAIRWTRRDKRSPHHRRPNR